jgi:hypothetical protein
VTEPLKLQEVEFRGLADAAKELIVICVIALEPSLENFRLSARLDAAKLTPTKPAPITRTAVTT